MRDGRKLILFFSSPDMSDNAMALFLFMHKNLSHDKYGFVWLTGDPAVRPAYSNTKYISCRRPDPEALSKTTLRGIDLTITSHTGHLLSYSRLNKDHKVIMLTHGCGGKGVKLTPEYLTTDLPGSLFDYLVHTGGTAGRDYIRDHFNIKDMTKLLPLGYPRNDTLFRDNSIPSVKPAVILWAPTFRQTKSRYLNETYLNSSELGIPLFTEEKELKDTDRFLQDTGVILEIKLHRLQQELPAHRFIKSSLSNIRFYNDDPGRFYESMHRYSALITDYSSIYVDFLAMDRPEAFVFSDINEYETGRGAFQYNLRDSVPGHIIYTLQDMKDFIKDTVVGIDRYRDRRRAAAMDFFGDCFDGNSAARITDFIIKEVLK